MLFRKGHKAEDEYLISTGSGASGDEYIIGMTIRDSSGNSITLDQSTLAQSVIEYEHHEIHRGSFYRVDFQKEVANGGTMIIGLTTPDTTKWLHFRPAVDVEVEASIILYENVTSITGGTAYVPRNANRPSANVSVATVVTDPTINTTGAVILEDLVLGSAKSAGGNSEATHEWVLKQNTRYALIVTNQTTGATNECNIRLSWYEHTDKS